MESYLSSIINLFAPPTCCACSRTLPQSMEFMCVHCRWDMPVTSFWKDPNNKVAQKFWGLVPIESACSYFLFRQGSNFQTAIHNLKYRGYWKTCIDFGVMFGAELVGCPPYDSVDLIIPVPLHRLKLLSRGYNQSEYIAKGLAKAMNLSIETNNLVRLKNNKAQARSKFKYLRWNNVNNIFKLKHPERLSGKHILLVDDVLTTGATLCSCAQTIVNAVPDCRISIVTLSVSDYELNRKISFSTTQSTIKDRPKR